MCIRDRDIAMRISLSSGSLGLLLRASLSAFYRSYYTLISLLELSESLADIVVNIIIILARS